MFGYNHAYHIKSLGFGEQWVGFFCHYLAYPTNFAQIEIRDRRFLLIRKTCGCNKSPFSLFLEFSICMLQLFKAWLLL
ncbi:hypothetical protein NC652_001614 [Populus alba x Populus x berolinensis]|nr:hypothetical protein NC652_001614 [Populus alba x Populus x berolinensis]